MNNSEQPRQNPTRELTPFERMFVQPIPPPTPPIQPRRIRRAPTNGQSEIIPTPFVWATNRRATVQSFDYLLENKIFYITGDVQCKRCDKTYQISFDVRYKFPEIAQFIAENRHTMNDRATIWMNPRLSRCENCNQENCVKPVIADKKKSINWLFLLLGQMLGCCTLEQLKYFCKHTNNHRTGAKYRLLYITYLGLCKQLDPNGPFNV
ncbi:uncharacterized protein LOC123886040 [Trifolium pratense]|uniref:uncharacterized protein LOC123886040 n=1 Tax=Trifolium pratense TaxID=57577 RepID=UPI001E693B51|nr:uncharacterized protein LOC123886040 [Trifolium pratense]